MQRQPPVRRISDDGKLILARPAMSLEKVLYQKKQMQRQPLASLLRMILFRR
jgi:hypothetical protein